MLPSFMCARPPQPCIPLFRSLTSPPPPHSLSVPSFSLTLHLSSTPLPTPPHTLFNLCFLLPLIFLTFTYTFLSLCASILPCIIPFPLPPSTYTHTTTFHHKHVIYSFHTCLHYVCTSPICISALITEGKTKKESRKVTYLTCSRIFPGSRVTKPIST